MNGLINSIPSDRFIPLLSSARHLKKQRFPFCIFVPEMRAHVLNVRARVTSKQKEPKERVHSQSRREREWECAREVVMACVCVCV